MPQKNECYQLKITSMTHEGMGVGRRPEGMAVFVPAAAVGDLAQVRLVKVLKNHCYGRIEALIEPSPDRVEPDCPVSRRCGGCVFRQVSYPAEQRYKQGFVEENLRRIGGISLAVEPLEPSPQADGYRNKAQYPVQQREGRLTAGFYAPRTHQVVDCRDCRLQPPLFGAILRETLALLEAFSIPAYDETTRTGLVRHIYLRQAPATGQTMLCLVVNGGGLPRERELAARLAEKFPQLASIQLNRNDQNTNVILGPRSRVLWGAATITDRLCGLEVSLSPGAFYQVNSPAAQQLYAIAAEYAGLTGRETLLDLYCGAGTIGLSMAGRCRRVIGVEIVPQAVENARENARRNGIGNARFLCADAAQAALQLEGEGITPDVVVLDPPRKGCDRALLETVARMAPRRVVYISCNSATLARDLAHLGTLGYRTCRCRPVDLFPRTAHVEAVALAQRE